MRSDRFSVQVRQLWVVSSTRTSTPSRVLLRSRPPLGWISCHDTGASTLLPPARLGGGGGAPRLAICLGLRPGSVCGSLACRSSRSEPAPRSGDASSQPRLASRGDSARPPASISHPSGVSTPPPRFVAGQPAGCCAGPTSPNRSAFLTPRRLASSRRASSWNASSASVSAWPAGASLAGVAAVADPAASCPSCPTAEASAVQSTASGTPVPLP